MPPSCFLFNEDGLSVLGFIDLSAYYSGWLQEKPIILGAGSGCKKANYSRWLQKGLLFRVVAKNAYYSRWLQKSLLFRVVAKSLLFRVVANKPTIPGGCMVEPLPQNIAY
jgi:hypothetical protein